MSVTLLQQEATNLQVSLSEAIRYMGIRGDSPEIKTIAEDLLPELCSVAVPKAVYGEYPVELSETEVIIGDIATQSTALRKNLDGCLSAVIFAATLGVGVDRLISRYSRLSPSKSVILGALGSAMIESWCDEVCAGISGEQEKFGKRIKPRFSPGYGEFELSSQTKIAKLLETEKRIGLYFTESQMMIPEKSVTALVGLY